MSTLKDKVEAAAKSLGVTVSSVEVDEGRAAITLDLAGQDDRGSCERRGPPVRDAV